MTGNQQAASSERWQAALLAIAVRNAANPSEINNPDNCGSFSPYGLNDAFYYARVSYDG